MTRLDVVGLGSLNIDYIVAAEEIPKTRRRELLSRFERGQEIGIDDHERFLSTLALAQSRNSSLVRGAGGRAGRRRRAGRAPATNAKRSPSTATTSIGVSSLAPSSRRPGG